MHWKGIEEVLAAVHMPAGYVLRRMSRTDASSVATRFEQWYPGIVVGDESPHLQESFYEHDVALVEHADEERDLLAVVAEHETDGVVAATTYQRNVLARTLRGRLGAISPEHRHSGLGFLGPLLLEKLGRAIGAELLYYFASLETRHQQVIAERFGYDLVGIMPGHDLDMVRPGEVKRIHTAIYAKLLVEDARLQLPDPEALTPRTRAVWQALFGKGDDT